MGMEGRNHSAVEPASTSPEVPFSRFNWGVVKMNASGTVLISTVY